MNSTNLYVRLFHGRASPDDLPQDWGFDGPIIGPVGITWTYGSIKIHNADWSDFEEFGQVEGMIEFGGKYYGDIDIFVEGDPYIQRNLDSGGTLLSYEAFQEIMRRPARPTNPVRRATINPLPLP